MHQVHELFFLAMQLTTMSLDLQTKTSKATLKILQNIIFIATSNSSASDTTSLTSSLHLTIQYCIAGNFRRV